MVLSPKQARFVSMYFRDESGVMRKVPGLLLHVSRGKPYEVYTLSLPMKTLELF